MDEVLANQFAARERIHVEKIVREFWEIIILNGLFNSSIGSNLVFKGGTALRLAYGSPRFSDDLDFTCFKTIDYNEVKKTIKAIENRFDEIRIKDLWEKRYMIIGEYGIREPWLNQAFSVKIEISKRVKEVDFENVLLTSSFSNIQVLGQVYTIGQILKEKKEALKTRSKSRDLFDIWYISQKQKIKVDFSSHSISLKKLNQELRKYLPTNYWKIIPDLTR